MAHPLADVVRLTPVPRIGDLFLDARGDGRTMRVSLHPERGIAVVSLWSGSTCRASFQLPLEDAGRLAGLLGPANAGPDSSDAKPGSVADLDAGHPYPGLADASDDVHTTGAIVPPDLSQAS